ncbi:hypothetical protein KEJ47_09270 [Candidatus Bathyarchaeota archaeon]|nr:hypothetical protein [Candidatus Bathyarchaeota archaeon]
MFSWWCSPSHLPGSSSPRPTHSSFDPVSSQMRRLYLSQSLGSSTLLHGTSSSLIALDRFMKIASS